MAGPFAHLCTGQETLEDVLLDARAVFPQGLLATDISLAAADPSKQRDLLRDLLPFAACGWEGKASIWLAWRAYRAVQRARRA